MITQEIADLDNAQKLDLFDELLTMNKLHRNEGEIAIFNLNEVCKTVGYDGDGFRYGTPFERFIQDNPGCVDAIHKWMAENFTQEQFDLMTPSDENDEEAEA